MGALIRKTKGSEKGITEIQYSVCIMLNKALFISAIASTSSSDDLESQIPTYFGSGVVNTTDEDNFQHTI